ncbi:transmembrane protein [Anaeramoeba ignava]|uniref:Transmembrane protein n=1 Tax=Anaeramoeba ignava TaxID=1746090 RepID=A0A9Q0RDF2_ANAIG|nr:transmembrane protein [Anaeramoeba ignava]
MVVYLFLRDFCSCFAFTITFLIIFIYPTLTTIKKIDLENLEYKSNIKNETGFDNKTEKLFWFIHISDTHLNKFHPETIEKFEYFVSEFIPKINPSFNILEKYNLSSPQKWLDIRGNHDSAEIYDLYDPNNFYYRYSSLTEYLNQTQRNPVNQFLFSFDFGQYQFISLDVNPYPHISSPLSFLSFVNESMLQKLESFLNQTQANQTILFMHHPTFLHQYYPKEFLQFPLIAQNNSIRHLSSKYSILALLNGHVHRKGMYSRLSKNQNSKETLELEVADFGKKNIFRIFAIDNDVFSFEDFDINDIDFSSQSITSQKSNEKKPKQKALIVVTNPKNARFITYNEPLNLIKKSQYIRVLIFPNNWDNVASVSCYIDGKKNPLEMKQVEKNHPLFVTKWDPQLCCDKGLHNLNIVVKNSNGEIIAEKSHYFSIDGTVKQIKPTYWNVIQKNELYQLVWSWLLFFFFLFVVGLGLVPQIVKFILKKIQIYDKFNQKMSQTIFEKPSFKSYLLLPFNHLIFNIWKYSLIPFKDFIFNFLSGIFLLFGPVSIGKMIGEDFGIAFLWGCYIDSYFIPYSLPAYHALVIISFVYFPSINTQAFASLYHLIQKKNKLYKWISLFLLLVSFFSIVMFLMIFTFVYYRGYFIIGVLTSFSLFWSSLLCLILDFRSLLKIYFSKSKSD